MTTRPDRVLAVFPHPDDIEILCAGTLIRLREAGFELHVATMTSGDKGSMELDRLEITSVRLREAERAAEVIGAASYRCLGFQDLEIVFDNDSRRIVAELVRRVDPALVFTTPPADYMADHEITSRLVRDACFNAAVRNYETGGDAPPASRVPALYYSDPIGGHDILGRPAPVTCVVDVTAQIEQKSAALACHESQRSWLQRQHGLDDYGAAMRRWSAARGALAGFQFGEAFHQHFGHPHPQEDLLAELLGAVRLPIPS
jgi:LmbE family N-acetylglucosaminyl deacetylase